MEEVQFHKGQIADLLNTQKPQGVFFVQTGNDGKFQLYVKEENGTIKEVRSNNCKYNNQYLFSSNGGTGIDIELIDSEYNDGVIRFYVPDQIPGKSYRGEIFGTLDFMYLSTAPERKLEFIFDSVPISSSEFGKPEFFDGKGVDSCTFKIEYHLDFFDAPNGTMLQICGMITIVNSAGESMTQLFGSAPKLVNNAIENSLSILITADYSGTSIIHKHQLMHQQNQIIDYTPGPSCAVVSGFDVTAGKGAVFSWDDSGGGLFQIRYKRGVGPWTDLGEFSTSPFSTELPTGSWEFQIRRKCGVNDYSEWSDSVFITI